MNKSDMLQILIDGKLTFGKNGRTYENLIESIAKIREWIMRTPFWEQTSLIFRYYVDAENNPDYINRNDPLDEIEAEKNLFFMDDNNPYICLRCRRPSEIVGFCQKCYNILYGLEKVPIEKIKLEDILCNERFIAVVEADPEYTLKIKNSILKDGMKNPIIIDKQNRILIGHHRYYIAKELGWDKIATKKNNIDFDHGMFYEGKGFNIYITKIDGILTASTTNVDDLISIIKDFERLNLGKTLNIECFINIGSDIRLRNIFIPERGDVVDPTWHDWYVRKFNKKPKIGRFS